MVHRVRSRFDHLMRWGCSRFSLWQRMLVRWGRVVRWVVSGGRRGFIVVLMLRMLMRRPFRSPL